VTAFSASDQAVAAPDECVLRAAVAAYLGRYRGQSRLHTGSDLKIYLTWCVGRDLDALGVGRADIERYVRWLQEAQLLPAFDGVPQAVGRGGLLPDLRHRLDPAVLSGRLSANINDFALVAMLGLLGLRIFEACGASIGDLGEEHGHRVLKVRGKGDKTVLIPLPPAVAQGDRPGRRRPRPGAGSAQRPRRTDGPARGDPEAEAGGGRGRDPYPADASAHASPYVRHHHARRRVSLRDVQIAARHADPRTTMRYDRARKNLDRHANYILAAYMASGT
jgi:integrase